MGSRAHELHVPAVTWAESDPTILRIACAATFRHGGVDDDDRGSAPKAVSFRREECRIMRDRLLRKLNAQMPWLAEWFGSRLDLEVPAYLVSLTVHAVLLISLGLVGHQVHRVVQREFRAQVPDSALSRSDSTFQDLDQTAQPPAMIPAAGSFAPNLAMTITSAPISAGGFPYRPTLLARSARILRRWISGCATEVVLPTAMMLGQNVSIKGNGAEHVGGVEGAVDRIAVEILRRLERGRTLVIWAFDASGSLQAERQRLSKHIETVYTHIRQLDENQLSADKGLLTLVVAFGQDRKPMTPKPTAELSEILEAIGDVPLDKSGIESTFTTVAEIIRHWGRYKDAAGQAYQPHDHRGHRRGRQR